MTAMVYHWFGDNVNTTMLSGYRSRSSVKLVHNGSICDGTIATKHTIAAHALQGGTGHLINNNNSTN